MDDADYRERIDEDTVGKYDVTPIFHDATAFSRLVSDLASPAPEVSHVAGIEALGLVLGGAVADRLGVGFVPVRKGGRSPLAPERLHRRTLTDYSGEEKTLELRRDALSPGDRVLLVDDWIETGAQMRAAAALVEACGATVAAVSVLHADETEGSEALAARYAVHSVG